MHPNTSLTRMVYASMPSTCPIMIPSGVVLMCSKPANRVTTRSQRLSRVRFNGRTHLARRHRTRLRLESIGPARVTCANPCAIEKKTATLTCEATGLPAPKYLWFYGSVSGARARAAPPVEHVSTLDRGAQSSGSKPNIRSMPRPSAVPVTLHECVFRFVQINVLTITVNARVPSVSRTNRSSFRPGGRDARSSTCRTFREMRPARFR